LYDRLKREGRLRPEDRNCNFVPKQLTPAELQKGYWDLLKRLYTPQAFLDRYFAAYRFPEFNRRRAEICDKANEGRALPTFLCGLVMLWRLFWTLAKDGSLWKVGSVYARCFFGHSLRCRSDIVGFAQFMNRCVTHWHFYKFTREATAGRIRLFNSS